MLSHKGRAIGIRCGRRQFLGERAGIERRRNRARVGVTFERREKKKAAFGIWIRKRRHVQEDVVGSTEEGFCVPWRPSTLYLREQGGVSQDDRQLSQIRRMAQRHSGGGFVRLTAPVFLRLAMRLFQPGANPLQITVIRRKRRGHSTGIFSKRFQGQFRLVLMELKDLVGSQRMNSVRQRA